LFEQKSPIEIKAAKAAELVGLNGTAVASTGGTKFATIDKGAT
jgi:hypothetical protein